MLGYSIVIPFLVFLVDRFGGNDFVYGIAGATYPAFQFFGSTILGRWSDTYGRKRILLLSHLGTLVAWLLLLLSLFLSTEAIIKIDSSLIGNFSISLALIFLFLARALDGLTGGNISVANAYLSDISTDKNRNSNFGKMGMSSSLGFIIGPALAGILGVTRYKEIIPVLAATFISFVALYLILYKLPESKFNSTEAEAKKAKVHLSSVLKIENVQFMVIIYFLTFLGFNFFYAAFPLHALKTLKWSPFELGIFFSFLSAIMILVQGPILKRISAIYSEAILIVFGSFFLFVNFILMAIGNISLIYVAAIFFALGNGIMWPSYLSLLSKVGGDENQGAVQGLANSSGSFASIVGLIFGGYLYGNVGTATFFMAAIVLFFIFILSFRLLKIIRKKN